MSLKPVTYFIMIITMAFASAQESNNPLVAFSLPVRNSLVFNRHLLSPTFSFVREQHKYVSIYNKREFVQFDNAPVTYIASHSGRFGENIGAGISAFQQDFGVLTSFGGVLNVAYNVRLQRDSNLTFGLNVGAYSSGLNTANIVSNFDDPAIQNTSNSFAVTINPGINYGSTFFDFGLSINNLALYNFDTSTLENNIPTQSLQAHIMYTGYMSSRGLFDDAKFTGLVRSEFLEDRTIVAANAMLTIPMGFWVQAGYNTDFGITGGLGINISQNIMLEYNYEVAIAEVNPFGPSHEIGLAYRFKSNKYYDYSRQDEVSGLLLKQKPKRRNTRTFRYNTKKSPVEKPVVKPITEATIDDVDTTITSNKPTQVSDSITKTSNAIDYKENSENISQKVEEQKEVYPTELQDNRSISSDTIKTISIVEPKKSDSITITTDALKTIALENKTSEQQVQHIQDSIINSTNDEKNIAIKNLLQLGEDSKIAQNELLNQYNTTIESRNETLRFMKEENDLSEQGIAPKARPFKSITTEKKKLQSIESELDQLILSGDQRLKELNDMYDDLFLADTIYNDVVMLYYRKKIEQLKTAQKSTIELKSQLQSKLQQIDIAIEFEKRRRIKRAEFDNEEDRYNKDRSALAALKTNTIPSSKNYTENDFDYGYEATNNIQILKDVNYAESGYYLVLAIHEDVAKRDDFISKVIASGETNVDFFYDVNTSRYYIYTNKYNDIQQANNQLNTKDSKPFKKNLSIVKIEN